MNWDRVERVLGTENLSRLAEKNVGVIGLGSGGALVAVSLAMSGVGNFVLMDDDALEDTNVVRHIADLTFVGQNKAEVTAELIKRRNPNARVEVIEGRVENHLSALENLDLLVVGVDGEGAKFVINEACLDRNLTAIYAGVYERGEGGDVVVVRPFVGPCYACWAAELREGLTVARLDEGEELDYGMIGQDGTLEAEPGLWLHVMRVASVQADLALNELLLDTDVYQPMPANTIIMANRELEIIDGTISDPYTSVWANVKRDPGCLVCGERARRIASLSDDTEDDDAGLSLDALMQATGVEFEQDDEE